MWEVPVNLCWVWDCGACLGKGLSSVKPRLSFTLGDARLHLNYIKKALKCGERTWAIAIQRIKRTKVQN